MRCRPAFLHDFFGATPGSAEHGTARWLNRRVGTIGNDAHFEQSLTQEGFLEEVHNAGLAHAVVVGRHTPSQHLPNEKIHEIVRNHPELIGIAAVDPSIQGEQGAIDAATFAIRELGLAGLDLEPGFCEPARHPDDPIYWPIYELAGQLQVPIFLMSGPTTPDPRFNDPAAVAKVAQAFPQLPIVIYHGYWPNVHQAIGLAFRYENIKLVPDMYLFQAGSDVYIQAANSFMSGQLLFGSSYPFRPIGQSIDDVAKLGLKESVIEDVLYNNAATLFGIEP
ncbi:putative amidohydrolase 2 [Advenella mimigardefordensis DPN7]|uniref:Putative amidohydrolase 2 n=2 Tax=Advenella mimigardefordensis TaxID=302406 RepID=W0P9P2_ADVMD|nr:putative amidohydrolase 2 [Advenella mimigardefordensis DPN7]